jgi:hypothetical protein
MGDGDNLRKSVYPDCLLCIEKIFEMYSNAKGVIGTETLARSLPPCPHKGLSKPRRMSRRKQVPGHSQG